MKPIVSVVTPAYNHALFVAETIRSVLNQSLGDVELCITDDASSDETAEVIRGFTDPRVRFEAFPENRGAATALNSAIRRSRGEFVCYLSSDDYFLAGKLESQVAFLRANPGVAAVFGLPRFIDERGGALPVEANPNAGVFEIPFREKLKSRADWLRWFFFNCNCLCHPTAMIRRSVFDEIGYFDRRFANLPDFDMWVRLCIGHDIHVVPEEVTAMRILDGARNVSAPRRDSLIRTQNEYYAALKHYRALPRPLLEKIFEPELGAHPDWSELSSERLLAEAALTGDHLSHRLFAIDTLLSGPAPERVDHQRLFEITGSVDLSAVEVTETLQTEIGKLRDELTASEARAHAIRNDALEIDKTLRAEIANLHEIISDLRSGLAAQQVMIGNYRAALTSVTDAVTYLRSRAARRGVAVEDINRLERLLRGLTFDVST